MVWLKGNSDQLIMQSLRPRGVAVAGGNLFHIQRIDHREIIGALYFPLHHAEIRRLRHTDQQHRPVHDTFTDYVFHEEFQLVQNGERISVSYRFSITVILVFKEQWSVPDYSAWFEAYLGGQWYIFDPRNNEPRIGRVLIARGRDAADVPISNTFGPNVMKYFKVWSDEVSSGQ